MHQMMSNWIKITVTTVFLLWTIGCGADPDAASLPAVHPKAERTPAVEKVRKKSRVIHVLVALCDNENQGIVPVPAHLGNGEDAAKNLYWGAAYGVRTHFSKSANWTKIAEVQSPKQNVLERLIFKHKSFDVYLIADAYRGSKMKQMTDDFFSAASGSTVENVTLPNVDLRVLGSSNLIVFVGHNGLMDFDFEGKIQKADDEKREAVILACASRNYFSVHLKKTGASPLLWTTNLMAPEAYILHDAIEGWARNETGEQVRSRAAAAYAKYQRISKKAAEGLLVSGW